MKKFKYSDIRESYAFYGTLIVLSLILVYFNHILGGIGFLVSFYLIYTDYKNRVKLDHRLTKEIESINDSFDEITRGAVFAVPFPLVIINEHKEITWYNTNFKRIIGVEDDILAQNIDKIIPGLQLPDNKKKYIEVKLAESHYRFYINRFKKETGEFNQAILLYGVDITDQVRLKEIFDDKLLSMMVLYIDNFDEVRQTAEEGKRSIVFAEIDRMISDFATAHNAYARRYEQDKYVIFLEKKDLMNIVENKFKILDKVREARFGNTIPVTLSIGATYKGENPLAIHNTARLALDVALGRGGDQAVLKVGDDLSYFGGKNKAQEKRSKVKARVISHALKQLILQSSNIIIMGHKNPDMDSIGSCLGVLEMVNLLDKPGYIVLNEVSPAIENVYRSLVESEIDFESKLIDSEEAMKLCDSSTLVCVLDNHRKNSCECPELLDITDKIVLIDHHRRGRDYIKNTTLTYLEPYASSASEMVTELLFYLTDKLEIPKVTAEALLAGITVDTKNFFYQTGVRTFEAASILKRQGADSIKVKQLFKDDAKTMMLKSEVISNMEVYQDNIAIGVLDQEIEEAVLIAAQAADDLLNILGIEASFVLTRAHGKTHISGRSLGEISVQLILEKLGGGGHLTSAGTQMEEGIEESIVKLKQAIDEYNEEDKDEIYID
ncbi:MAG: DHH family phosphoesterase [Tissierellia bacterium]|nr:DHH family phosphoesterase [Tissierellia bacterium]